MLVVTLRPSFGTHTISHEGLDHIFDPGVPTSASAGLAEVCRGMVDRRGRPLFDVRENPDKDLEQILGVQLEFDSWPSLSP